MARINVIRPFTFTHDDGRKEPFPIGSHEVPDHVANHFFTKAHTDAPKTHQPQAGTPAYADAMRALVKKRQSLLDEALEALAEAEAAEEAGSAFDPNKLPDPPVTGSDEQQGADGEQETTEQEQPDQEQAPIRPRRRPASE